MNLLMPGLAISDDGELLVDTNQLAAIAGIGGDIGAEYDVDAEDENHNPVDLADSIGAAVGFDPILMSMVRTAQNRSRQRRGLAPITNPFRRGDSNGSNRPGIQARPSLIPGRAPATLARPSGVPTQPAFTRLPARQVAPQESSMFTVREIHGSKHTFEAAGTYTVEVKPQDVFDFADITLYSGDAALEIEEIRYGKFQLVSGTNRWQEFASTAQRRNTLSGQAAPAMPLSIRYKAVASSGALYVSLHGNSQSNGLCPR